MDDFVEGAKETGPIYAEMSTVLCIVCDIRSFTELETRVHDLIFETLDYGEYCKKREVRDAHKQYVEETQKYAYEKLTAPIEKWIADGHERPRHVIKATGDGFMLALSMAEGGRIFTDMVPLAYHLVLSAYSLTIESAIDADEKLFGSYTKKFLKSHGDILGFNYEDLQKDGVEFEQNGTVGHIKNTRFRVAAAATLGFANFVNPVKIPEDPEGIILRYLPRLEDVSGYGINLAFRLCDQAGRGFGPEKSTATPPMLLDRRLGRIIRDYLPERYKDTTSPFSVRPWPVHLTMKGLEERWAYQLLQEQKVLSAHA